MKWSSQMGRQETEGHSRTHPRLSKLELKIAGRDAWEPGQAMSKPSSLEAAPIFSSGLQCLHSHLGPPVHMPGSPAPAGGEAARRLWLGVQQAAQLSPNKRKPFLAFQKEDGKAYPGRSRIRRWVYSFSSFVKIPRHSASWSSEQDSAGVASVAWMPQILSLL